MPEFFEIVLGRLVTTTFIVAGRQIVSVLDIFLENR
jgi:hypothetical protein